jgi:hypothetical protein
MSNITLTKWVAGFDIDGRFITGTLNVRETPKKYIVIDPTIEKYGDLAWVIGYSTQFFKDKMFDTEREAIQASVLEYDAQACVAKADYDKAAKKFTDARAALQVCDASQ